MNLSLLNKEQKEAVLYNDGHLLIIAGAGSGKTRVITYKIATLIENGVSPSNILAITFTNKAADEMKNRVINILNDNSKKVFISTFHKFCGRILRAYIDKIGYNTNFSIYDADDQKKVVNDIIKDLNLDEKKIKAKAAISHISYSKNHGISIDEFEKNAKNDIYYDYAKIYREYDKRMFKLNSIDFDDMLILTVKILKDNEDIRKKIINKFKYILVDEYQDTNLIQFEIIKLLIEDGKNLLTVVGDDDQSIYKFRGADIRNILEFEKKFKNSKIIKLTENYRSTNNILKVANSIIKNNIGRKEKFLWSNNSDGSVVTFKEYEDDSKEAYNIINNIKINNDYKNTVILYRNNVQSRKFEEMCVSFSVPYSLVGGINFYERREIKDLLAYLRLLSNPKDSSSLLRIINVPKRGIGETTINKLIEYSYTNNISLFDAMINIDKIDIKISTKEKIKLFIDLLVELKQENDIDIIIDKILNKFYIDFLSDEYGIEEAKERIDNIYELKNKAISFKNAYTTFADDDLLKGIYENLSAHSLLEDFLNEIALISATDNMDEETEKLTLMTLHASKGLEFDNVYLTGLNEGIFPSYQSITSDDTSDVEEERRLCYVGVTRAKKNLFLSAARRRMQNGKYNNFQISRFVDEIDDKLVKKDILKNNFLIDDRFDEFWGYNRKLIKKKFDITKGNNYRSNDNLFLPKNKLRSSIDTYKTGANIKKLISLQYKVGDKVSHIKFGEGKVLEINDIGRDFEVTVEFLDYGKKTLFATFAKLEKI